METQLIDINYSCRPAEVIVVDHTPVDNDLGMRELLSTAAENLLELTMRRYERTSTLLTSNQPVEDWGKLRGDTAPSPPCSTGSSTMPTSSLQETSTNR